MDREKKAASTDTQFPVHHILYLGDGRARLRREDGGFVIVNLGEIRSVSEGTKGRTIITGDDRTFAHISATIADIEAAVIAAIDTNDNG